jgi:hypothetical protein
MSHILLKKQHPSQLLESYSTEVAKAVGKNETLYHSRLKFLNDAFIPFPMGKLMVREMAPHTAIVGSSGAGKTIMQKMWLEAALVAPRDKGLLYRALVYDPKRELYPILIGMGVPPSQIIVTNPFDLRSSAWDLAEDFKEPAQIEELSEMIIPRKQNSSKEGDDFFDNAARIILQDIIAGFRARASGCWTLRDLTEVCANLDYMKDVLQHTENGKNSWRTFLDSKSSDGRMSDSVLASLFGAVRPFQTLASVWERAETKFSLEQWHQGSGVILMGADPRRESTLTRTNQLMFRRMSQLVLSRDTENPIDLTWFFLDEVREAQKLDGFRQLLTEGRSKGARVMIGFQDVDGMIDLYGERCAEEIIGLCANRIILHLDNPRTREWASSFFGEIDDETVSYNMNEGRGSGGPTITRNTGESISLQIAPRKNVLPIEFLDLPLASIEHGVSGFYASTKQVPDPKTGKMVGSKGQFKIEASDFQDMFDLGKDGPARVIERPAHHQLRISWRASELKRFGIKTEEVPDDTDEHDPLSRNP